MPHNNKNTAGRKERKRIIKSLHQQISRKPVTEAKILIEKASKKNANLSITISEFLSNIDPLIGFNKTQILTVVFSKPVTRDDKYYRYKDWIRIGFNKIYLDVERFENGK